MSSSLIGRPIHSALCHIKAKSFVNYYFPLSLSLSIYLSIYEYLILGIIYLSIFQSTYLTLSQTIYLSIYEYIILGTIYLSQSTYLSQSIYLYFWDFPNFIWQQYYDISMKKETQHGLKCYKNLYFPRKSGKKIMSLQTVGLRETFP